jgi:hypothetical protein
MGISLRPKHLKRYKDLALLLIKYGRADIVTDAGLDEALLDDEKKKEVTDDISELSEDLEKLGPTYIKLGQFLSTRSDMLPGQYLEVLTRLQDNVEPFPFEKVEKIISKEIGMRFSKANYITEMKIKENVYKCLYDVIPLLELTHCREFFPVLPCSLLFEFDNEFYFLLFL